MKLNFVEEKELLFQKLLKVPVVDYCEMLKTLDDGFVVEIKMEGGVIFCIRVCVMQRAFPAQVKERIEIYQKSDENRYFLIMAPYISDVTGELCEKNRVGYLDLSGNCLICVHSLYLLEKGNPNRAPERRQIKSIFESTSTVSSLILRELLRDISRPWKLKHLSEKLGCSIGQVSKVKNYLCEQLWAEMREDGIVIMQPDSIMKAWSEQYSMRDSKIYTCYTLESIPMFEKR